MRPPSPRASDLRRSGGSVEIGGVKKNKTLLRLSSSLDDLPSYSKLDIEEYPPPGNDLRSRLFLPSAAPLLTNAPSFSKDKSPSSFFAPLPQRSKCAGAAAVAVCLLLSLVFLVVYVGVLYLVEHRSPARDSSYYVIMDCGSTGTRVYVYESRVKDGVDLGKKGGLPISLRSLTAGMEERRNGGGAYRRLETKPGLDKLVRNETGLRAAIIPLVRLAEKQIPADAHRRTRVFLYATAGIRRLPSADAEWILNKALEILGKTATGFVCRKSWVKTISGMEEAYLGWIALNYEMGTLGFDDKETFGALDLGGSSLQVTFENQEAAAAAAAVGSVSEENHSLLSLHIGSVYHHLIAYSLSGYGLNDAFDKSVALLLRRRRPSIAAEEDRSMLVVRHPCLNDGYRGSYSCAHCAAEGIASPASQTPTTVRGGVPVVPVELVGAPHWGNCSALAKSTVNLSSSEWSSSSSDDAIDCDIQPCALASNQPRPRGHFFAMSGFFFVFRFFNLSADATLDDLLEKGKEFCERTWEDAEKSVSPQPFIHHYCFRAPYVSSLLRDGLHIGDSQVLIGSGSITWTLGVALLEAGQAFSRRPTFANYMMKMVVPGTIHPTILVFVLLMPLLFLGAIFIASKRLRTAFRSTYLPLFRRSSGPVAFQYFNSANQVNPGNVDSILSKSLHGSIISKWVQGANKQSDRAKTPLSPMVQGTEQSSFVMQTAKGLVGDTQLAESSMNPSIVAVSQSNSYSNLNQMYPDNGIGTSWAPRPGKLWSRRSQSREDLSILTENYKAKG